MQLAALREVSHDGWRNIMTHLFRICRITGVTFFFLILDSPHPAITAAGAVILVEFIRWGASIILAPHVRTHLDPLVSP